MHGLVAIEDARLEYDDVDFTPCIVFSGRLNLYEMQGMYEFDPHGYSMDNLATSIGFEILRQARFLYELSKED